LPNASVVDDLLKDNEKAHLKAAFGRPVMSFFSVLLVKHLASFKKQRVSNRSAVVRVRYVRKC